MTVPPQTRIARASSSFTTPRRRLSSSLTTPALPSSTKGSTTITTSNSKHAIPIPNPNLSSTSSNTTTTSKHALNGLLNSTKKYKAPLTSESKPRTFQFPRSKAPLTPILASPSGSPSSKFNRSDDRDGGRPRTPHRRPDSACGNGINGGSWGRSMTPQPSQPIQLSEMDVSNVDPEEVLVDSKTVEPADMSGEFELDLENVFNNTSSSPSSSPQHHGKQDKVMVSVRVKCSTSSSENHRSPSAWTCVQATNTIKLDSAFSKHSQLSSGVGAFVTSSPNPSSSNNASSFTYDAILTGSANKPIYTTTARAHVQAAMDGYNAVVFAYGQTASGKTYTLSGDSAGEEPGIIPRAMKDVFAAIKRTPDREYLLRCSYLEIYNETIYDLLAPPGAAAASPVQIQGGVGNDIILSPLREEVVTSLKGVKDVLRRGEAHRRTACTDWNERSSRSHSVFRMVVESREKDESVEAREAREAREREDAEEEDAVAVSLLSSSTNGRKTPGLSGRQTPGFGSHNLGAPRLQSRGGKSVRTSVLSLIDLAGSEKATSDKERTREGKYINTSLLTLGTVIGTLADNAAKKKTDHVPYRNSKLTRLLQPSLSGNARISVICTINPDPSAVSESMSTLLFAKRIKNVKLNAQKKEVVDTDALIERYKKEIEDLKARLAEREREAEVPTRSRRLSTKEKADESKAMKDLNARIQQLTKLILTSQTVDDGKTDDSRPASPIKVDFDMSPYQLQQELLNTKTQLESQETQILSLEEALLARPPLPPTASENEKDSLIASQAKTIRELEIVVRGYEDNLGEPLRKVKEDVENEWMDKVEEEKRKREEKERWAEELVKQLDRERKMRGKLEEERRALAAFVSKFDSLGLGLTLPPSSVSGTPTILKTPARGHVTANGGNSAKSSPFAGRGKKDEKENTSASETEPLSFTPSPMKMEWTGTLNGIGHHGSPMLLMEQMPEEAEWCDVSFEGGGTPVKEPREAPREVFGGKENTVMAC